VERAAQAKTERYNMRLKTLTEVEKQPYTQLVSLYKSEKKIMEEDNDTAMNKS
jgi:hypothetical protein